jgi:hypothetical protein
MHTHTNHPIFITPTGQPFRADHVVAAHWTKSGQGLRIATDVGEVITDEFASREVAQDFLWKLGHAMRGISDTGPSVGQATEPIWATAENATIASEAVLAVGGTREHAARVYASTLLGEGQPAAAIDAEAMELAWTKALESGGPVHVVTNMPDLDHSRTDDPLTSNSPFARLAFVPTYMGIDSARVVFHTVGDLVDHPIVDGCALTLGEGGSTAFHRLRVPRKIYSWCSMNDMLFGEWVGQGGPAIRHEHRNYSARWDGGASQVVVLERLAEFLRAHGYDDAAARVLLAGARAAAGLRIQ